jgi:hypothetical protein
LSGLLVQSAVNKIPPFGESSSDQSIDIVRVEFQCLLEQTEGFREAIFVCDQLQLVEYRPAAHGEIDGVGVPGLRALFRPTSAMKKSSTRLRPMF